MDKAITFATLWFGVSVTMAGSIIGTELLGWPVENPMWWTALAGSLTLSVVNIADYLFDDPDA